MKTHILEIVTALFLSSGVDTSQYTPTDAMCLARAVYHEARGESRVGQRAVAHVVLNRTEDDRFPDSICAVVKQAGQFAPQLRRAPGRLTEPDAFENATVVALNAMSGASSDPTGGATYFYAPKAANPQWARKMKVSAVIDGHRFLKRRE